MIGEWQTILGKTPSKSNSYKIVKIGNFSKLAKQKSVTDYEKSFYMQCDKYRNLNYEGLFEFHIKAYYASMAPDLDGCFKVTLDCLQQVKAIKNDNKCVKIIAEKFIDKINPRIVFKIVEV